MIRVLSAALVLAVAPPATAQDAAAQMAERLRNNPVVEALVPYGLNLPPRVRGDKTVQFGKALRVPLDGHPDFWRVGVITPTTKPVKKGERIVIAFWARAEKTENGAPGIIRRVQLEAIKPAIRTIFEKAFDIGPEWKMYQIAGIADQDYPAGAINAALHLDGAKQVLDIGPIYILDYGAVAQ